MEKYNKYILILIAVIVIGMSIGYSALNSDLKISGEVNYRPQEDVRVTNFTANSKPDNITIEYSDYSKNQVKLGYTTTGACSITYTVEITNYSTVNMGILEIYGLDENVEVQENIIGTKLVGSGGIKEFNITFNSTTPETKTYLLTFEFVPIYTVTYNGLGNTDDYVQETLEGGQLKQDLGKDSEVCSVTMDGKNYTDYTFSNGTIIIENITGDIVINGYAPTVEKPTTPNPPELNGDMIPVYYHKIDDKTGEWRKADESNLDNKWYDYASQKWANAVTVVANSYAPKSNGIEEVNFVNQVYNSYKSTNQGKDSTTSNLTLKFKTGSTGGTLSFDYQVSSESYDKLTIKVNDETIANKIKGNKSDNYSKDLEANTSYTIIADYVKDISGKSNDDTAYIKNLVVPSDLAEPLTVDSTGNYQWVQMYEYEVASSYEIDVTSGIFSLNNLEGHYFSSDDVDKYMCSDGVSTSCNELYKITNVDENTVKEVEKYGTESVDRNYYKNLSVDSEIPMYVINTMWVWIPRYSYTIKSENGGTNYYGKRSSCTMPTRELPGEIDVKFISKNMESEKGKAQYIGDKASGWYTNEAFDFPETDEEEKNTPTKRGGIWVSKFEPTGTSPSCTNTSCNVSSVTVKPGIASIKSKTVSNFYFMSRSMQLHNASTYGFDENNGDLHMMKNDEWGAVAYLSQSRYGKYGNSEYTGANKEVYVSGDSNYITGDTKGNINGIGTTTYAYNDMTNLGKGKGQAGPGASTTGNIYGIYDMSGGAYEYVMGVLEYDEQGVEDNEGKILTGSSGFKGLSSSGSATGSYDLPNEKYYNKYKSANPTSDNFANAKPELACNGGICYGHALSETYGASSGNGGWYIDYAYFVNRSSSWFACGGRFNSGNNAGVFSMYYGAGGSSQYFSTRLVLTP